MAEPEAQQLSPEDDAANGLRRAGPSAPVSPGDLAGRAHLRSSGWRSPAPSSCRLSPSIAFLGRPRETRSRSPTPRRKAMFTVGADGRGALQGWMGGSSGSGGGPAGSVGFFELATVDSVGGITITHHVAVYLTNKTEIVIGTQQLQRVCRRPVR